MDNYVIARERFGQYSLEMIMAITYALNVLQVSKKLELESKGQQMSAEMAKIRKVLDVNKMEQSIAILSKSTRLIFQTAIDSIKSPTDEKSPKLTLNDAINILSLENTDKNAPKL